MNILVQRSNKHLLILVKKTQHSLAAIYLHIIFITFFIILDIICNCFPNPKRFINILLEWIEIVGLDKSDLFSVYQKKVNCGAHFTENCSSLGTKQFNTNSYPTLNLPCTYV